MLGAVFSITHYSYSIKTDFTSVGATLNIMCMIMLLYGLFLMFYFQSAISIIVCGLLVALYTYYIIFDVEYNIRDKKKDVELDDYVIASVMIYVDVFNFIYYLLNLLWNAI